MTTLYRDPNTGNFALPESITAEQAANSWSPVARNVGVNFGRSIPSYANLTSNNVPNNNNITLPTALTNSGTSGINPSTISFTDALIKILKDAQGRNTTGQAGLMKQGQDITGLGINDAVTNFNNPLLAPNSGTSLGRSATGEFDPALLSIENQQKLSSQNLGNITDLVNMTGDNYQKEQDRIANAEENRLDRIASAAKASSNVTFDTQGTISKFSNSMKKIKGEDGYIDPQEWIAARELWASGGGSDSSFVSNFKRYLNPLSYKLAGIKTTETEEEKTQALIDSIFN